MTSLGNQDFRKFIDESRTVAAKKKAKPKKKKERPVPAKKLEEDDPDAPKYRYALTHIRSMLTLCKAVTSGVYSQWQEPKVCLGSMNQARVAPVCSRCCCARQGQPDARFATLACSPEVLRLAVGCSSKLRPGHG
jgi:hypothetical protein